MFEPALRIACLCLVLAGVETVHGIARMLLLVPRIGRLRAQRVGIVTGSLLAFAVCFLMVPTLGPLGPGALLALGALLSGFMAAFDLVLGRFAARRSWQAALEDFDPRRGNLLSVGLVLLVFFPLLAMSLRSWS